jgi:hypothetical protein
MRKIAVLIVATVEITASCSDSNDSNDSRAALDTAIRALLTQQPR